MEFQVGSHSVHHSMSRRVSLLVPLRLNGGGDDPFASQERVNLEHQGNVMQTSLSEQDIRDILFEAGYTIEEIDNVLAANNETGSNAGLHDLSNSKVSVESEISSTESIRGIDLTDMGDISLSDSGTENVFDTLKEIRVKNVDKVVIGTLNINSLAPKFDELREIIGILDPMSLSHTRRDIGKVGKLAQCNWTRAMEKV